MGSTGSQSSFTTTLATIGTNATFAGGLISANSGGYFRIQNAAGNSTYPTYSFQDDGNTGMMSSSTDSLSFVTGGTTRLLLNNVNATFAGAVTISGVNDTYNFKALATDTDSWFGVYEDANNSANIILTRSDSAEMFKILGHTGAATFAGTIDSGTITSTGIVKAATTFQEPPQVI